MDSFIKFETETYPQIWHSAYEMGVNARKQGMPRVCTLQGSPFCTPSGNVLKVYLSAWEQGWDEYEMPEEFVNVESVLKDMTLHQYKADD